MVHYYVSPYFYNTNENEIRKKLKIEFTQRYSWITILENNTTDYFVDYELVNNFLKTIDKTTFESITMIDTDLILHNDFRKNIEENIKTFHITHNCKQLLEVKEDKKLYAMPSMTKTAEGFSGASWSFSKEFLETINYELPDKLYAGGCDYLLGKLFIQKRPEQFFTNLLGDSFYNKNFKDFYNKTKRFHSSGKNLEIDLMHNFHGPRNQRLTDFNAYRMFEECDKLEECIYKRNENIC